MLMHEVGIASSILEAAHREAERRHGARVAAVGVRVGVLSGVDIEALRFAFECIVKDTDDAGVALTAESCPRINGCEDCGCEFASPAESPFVLADCPQCGSWRSRFVSGDQLDLAYVEVEEP
jgi:hydrogenase nickel incorporation protein HypA/HybF